MTREELKQQEEIIKDGLKFYLTCLEDKDIPHPEIKPRTAQYIHEKYIYQKYIYRESNPESPDP